MALDIELGNCKPGFEVFIGGVKLEVVPREGTPDGKSLIVAETGAEIPSIDTLMHIGHAGLQ